MARLGWATGLAGELGWLGVARARVRDVLNEELRALAIQGCMRLK